MRMRHVVLAFALACSGGALACAQSLGATAGGGVSPDAGSVAGHVICGDTQRPARVAQVRLVPLAAAGAGQVNASKDRQPERDAFGNALNAVETAMDGSFQVRNVRPGRYVVRADLGGYVIPLLQFTPKQLRDPDEATLQRMASDLQIVEVRPRAESRVEVTLQHGATISGTVRYDDGSPAIGLGMQLLVSDAEGKWTNAPVAALTFNLTDSNGRYVFPGLPAGRYAVEVILALSEHTTSSMPMPEPMQQGGSATTMEVSMTRTLFELSIFSGDKLRQRDAVGFRVEGSGEDGGHDLLVPLSKLHQVLGQVLAPDGHPLNSGRVVLRYPDDRAEVSSVTIDPATRQFRFPYVPEGSYTLAVENAREVAEAQVPNASGVISETHTEEKALQRYGTREQPLIVANDMEGVLLAVPEVSAGAKAGAPTQP